MKNIAQASSAYSYLGRLFLNGSVEAAKFFYGNIWAESPPLIRTISELQGCLTSTQIVNNTNGLYSAEFLYYWGMTCLGEQSSLIIKELGIAEACFRAIKDTVPQAEARLAYIKLLQSTEPAKSQENVCRLDVLRQWANRQDLFSRIGLAKISFYSFLCEEQMEISGLPIQTMRLLEVPCQKGHPVAVRFWNDICTCAGSPERAIDSSRVDASTLYDFKTSANMQIRP